MEGAGMENSYLALNDMQPDELRRAGCMLLEVGGLEARLRWAAARAHHHPGGRDDKGRADGTLRAIDAARKQLILCATCGALVQLQAVRRLARRAGRTHIEGSDGCGSPDCTSSHAQPARFKRGQAERAAGLLSGSHSLVLPPPTTAARAHLWVAPAHLAHATALRLGGGGSGDEGGDASSSDGGSPAPVQPPMPGPQVTRFPALALSPSLLHAFHSTPAATPIPAAMLVRACARDHQHSTPGPPPVILLPPCPTRTCAPRAESGIR